MKILHILVDGPGSLPDGIAEAQGAEHEVETLDLSEDGLDYGAVVDRIFACYKVISW
jgi:hypothetical protein